MRQMIKSVLSAAVLALGFSTMPASAAMLPAKPIAEHVVPAETNTKPELVHRRGGHRPHIYFGYTPRYNGYGYGYRNYDRPHCGWHRKCWRDGWGYRHCRWIRTRCY